MAANITMGKLSDKLHEMLVQDMDFKNSELNKYLDNLATNIILTTLSSTQRIEFYQLLLKNDYDLAIELVRKYIPDFHKRILVKAQETLDKNL